MLDAGRRTHRPIWDSYIQGALPPSNSYAVRVHLRPAMKLSLRYSSRSEADAKRSTARHPESPVAGNVPAPGEVLAEIGLVLAIHLAVALAVVLTLRAFGIA